MFTGIIEKTVPLLAAADTPMFRRLTLPNPGWPDVQLGESIAVNGVCLTVAELPSPSPSSLATSNSPLATPLIFDVIRETLDKTNLGLLTPGTPLHLERALKMSDRLSGHFVQGHVDGTASLLNILTTDREVRLTLEPPDHLTKYLTPKGSVTLDGVSLTIASISPDLKSFDVALIPTTVQLTALTQRPPGWPVNIEMDILTKTIVHYLSLHAPPPNK